MSTEREAKVYVNGSLVGTHESPEELAAQIREARRRGEVSEMVNVSVKDRTKEVIVNADAGRARRPLLVVEDGETLVSQEEMDAIETGDIDFEDLVRAGRSSSSTPRRRRTCWSASRMTTSPTTTPTSRSTRSSSSASAPG